MGIIKVLKCTDCKVLFLQRLVTMERHIDGPKKGGFFYSCPIITCYGTLNETTICSECHCEECI